MDLPNTLANDDVANATLLMANLEALANALDSIRNGNIAKDAGIDWRKLANPYHIQVIGPIPALPFVADSNVASPVMYGAGGTGFPATDTRLTKFRYKLRSGGAAWLCGVEAVGPIDQTNTPELVVEVDSHLIGGANVSLDTDDAIWTIENSNMFDSPLYPLTNNSVIEVSLNGPGADELARGMTITMFVKVSPVA